MKAAFNVLNQMSCVFATPLHLRSKALQRTDSDSYHRPVYSYAFCVFSTLLGFKLRTTNHYSKTTQMRKSRFFNTAKSDGIAHPMNLRTQYHKTVSWNCKRSVALLQTHKENILPYTVKIGSARAVTTFSRNFRFFAIRKSQKMPEWNFSSIHGTCMSKIVYTNS